MSGNKGLLGITFIIALSLLTLVVLETAGAASGAGVIDFSQCANGASDAVTCADGWTSGNLNPSNSHYHEDESVAQRLVISVPNGSLAGRTISLTYDAKKNGKHAYDSLASWNYTVTGADRCQELSAGDCPGGPSSAFPVPDDNTVVPPSGPGFGVINVTNVTSAHMIPVGSGRLLTMYGGTITGVSVSHSDPTGGDDVATVTITYNIPSYGKVMLLYGGHLAPSELIRGWGDGLGASNVGGGSTHISLDTLDGSSAGNRDNSIQTDAILPQPGTINIEKITVPSPDPTGTSFGFTTGGGQMPASFNLSNGQVGSYTVDSGAYTVTEIDPLPAFILTGLSCINDAGSTVTINVSTHTASITLNSAGYVNCTYTNTLQQPSLVVIKNVINDNGGTAVASGFTMHIEGASPSSNDFPGSGSGTSVTLDADTAYLVSETGPPGYAQTLSTDCSGTVGYGQSKTCTVTNDDHPGTLVVKKVVINDDGGTLGADDFSFHVNGGSAQPFEADGQNDLTVDAGIYTITEPAMGGYTTTYDNCADVVVPNGGTQTCTITNNDEPAHIIVVKHVTNDNGGDAVAGDFTMHISGTAGTADFAGSESGIDTQVNAGTYSISEDSVAGYASGYSGDCSGSIANGETRTCTITNNDIGPKLTVTKIVVNDNGGTKAVPDFSLFVDDQSVTSGEENIFDAGTYTASETADSGYASTISGNCDEDGNVDLDLGDIKSCTITNDDIQPKLTVIKIVINDNGGSEAVLDFPLFVDDTSVISGVENGFNVSTYTVSETGDPDYAATFGGDCDADGTITLNSGDAKECTVTNDDRPAALIVIKNVVNDNFGELSAENFTIHVTGTDVFDETFPGNEFGTTVTLDAGEYSVTEDSNSAYTSFFENCNGTIANGETKTCTITNDDKPAKLTVIKEVVNDNGGIKGVGDFSLFIDSEPVTSGNGTYLLTGVYTVSEGADSGYAATFGGDCNESGSVTLEENDTKTCMITNNDIAPKLTVMKVVINDNSGTKAAGDFPLFVNDTMVVSGEENTFGAGTYTVSEVQDENYTSTFGGDCDADGTVILNSGDVKSCMITNDDKPSTLVIIKHVINDNGGTATADMFTIHVNGGGVSSNDFAGDEGGVAVTLDDGVYSVDETGSTNYYAPSFSEGCFGFIAKHETKTCTITNDDIESGGTSPTLVVIKHVINDNGGAQAAGNFTMSVTGTNVMPGSVFEGNEVGTTVTLDAGEYSVAETGPNGYDSFLSSTCSGNITDGQLVTCTIINDDRTASLVVIKHVINDNSGTSAADDFTITVTGTNVQPSGPFIGNESGTTVMLDAGSYSVSESGPGGYTQSLSGCSGTMANGETKTCTIINDDVAPAPSPNGGDGGGSSGGGGGGAGGSCTHGYTLSSPVTVAGTAGSSVTVPVTFSTTGTCSASTTVTANVPLGWMATSAATGTVSAGNSKTVNIVITIPSGAITSIVAFSVVVPGGTVSSQTTLQVTQPEQSDGGSGGSIQNPAPGPANEPEITTETPSPSPLGGGLTGLLTANPNAIGAAIILIALLAYLIWRHRKKKRK